MFNIPHFEYELENLAERRDGILESIYRLKKSQEGIVRSNKGGWHSSGNLHAEKDPEIKWLMRQVFLKSADCLKKKVFNGKDVRMGMVSSWVNINPKGAWNVPHMHLPAEWSGVVYLQTDEVAREENHPIGDGEIIFINPVPYGVQYMSKPTQSLRPSNGKILLFPGYVLHMVAPHQDDRDRISVAFNIRVGDFEKTAGPFSPVRGQQNRAKGTKQE